MSEISIQPNNVLNSKTNNVKTGSTKEVQEAFNKTNGDKAMSNAMKIALGATALAGTIAVGILCHKKIESNKLTKQINEVSHRIKSVYIDSYNQFEKNKIWDTKILEKQIADIEQLPKKEKVAKLNEMLETMNCDRGLNINLHRDASMSEPFFESLPSDIKATIESGDRYKASKMYLEYCDTLFHESTTNGKNLDEVLEKVFGKETAIKSHNYDVSKEYSKLATNGNTFGAGYQAYIVTSENKIVDRRNFKAGEEIFTTSSCYTHGVMGRLPKGSTTPVINSGITKDGQKYVGITYGGDDIAHGFTLYAPKGQDFTPAQKDLMSINTEKLSKEDINILLKMPRGEKDSNYDVVLSVVKYLADKCKA